MIPIDRKEQNRQEIESNLTKDSNDEEQSKINEGNNSQENPSEEITNDKPSTKENAQNDEYVLYKFNEKTI